MKTTAIQSICRSWTTSLLISVIALQWILFTVLLLQRHQQTVDSVSSGLEIVDRCPICKNDGSSCKLIEITENEKLHDTPLEGVAVTIMYRSPKWFYLRYKVMLDNALANLPNPNTWKVHIFYNDVFLKDQQFLEWNPGLKQMFQGLDSRVIVTPLPSNLTTRKKPKDVLLSLWFWKSISAERVLLFSGNGAFCGNQVSDAWTKFGLLDLDYLGVPSFDFNGLGGDGSSHSLRSRQGMIRVLQYNHRLGKTIDLPEHRLVIKSMLQMNTHQTEGDASFIPFKIATKEQTVVFGGVLDLTGNTSTGLIRLPLVVAGTHPRLTYSERDTLLKHCPELKVIFPSLHDPSCFGAHPIAETCKNTICALQENIPSHGC